MPPTTHTTADAEGRVMLPPTFANAALVIEKVSATELVIRHVDAAPGEQGVVVAEELRRPLPDRDRDIFLGLLKTPPPPTQAFLDAVARHKARRGE